MVERQLSACALAPAVLAGEVVAHEDIGAGEADDVFFASQRNVFQQPQHGRHFNTHADGANLAVVLLDDFYFALKEQLHRLLPVDDY